MSGPNRQDIAPAELDRFVRLVEARLGIRADTADLRTALAERVAATGASVSTYVERLDNQQAAEEWSTLGNHLTVPETYFFRNTAHWKAFAEHVIPRIVDKQGAQSPSLRIWSAGCSTGEEPYTIAMVLAEMGLSRLVGMGSILATDLLDESLATAKKACYGHNSFRGVPKERIDRCFQRDGNLLTVGSDIRETVAFRRLNLADATAVVAFIAREGPFHVIFCRNVLIYFTPKVCTQLLDQLADALTADGTLFLGHSEFPHMWTNTLESIPVGDSFVWGRRPRARGPEHIEESSELTDVNDALMSPVPARTRMPCRRAEPTPDAQTIGESVGSSRLAPTVTRPSGVTEPCARVRDIPVPGASGVGDGRDWWSDVTRVLEHMQAGRRDQAFALSQQLVAENELLPEAHYALGLVLEEAGDVTGAVNCYSRATFLDTTFAHAHWRLALTEGVWKLGSRAIAEGRWAVRAIARDSDARIKHLSGIGRRDLTKMMEQTLEWLLRQKESKAAFSVS